MAGEAPFGGTGNYQHLGDAIAWLRTIDPRSVLDVGCGFGRWGVLCREFLDIWRGHQTRETWALRLVGVDAYPGNLKQHHHYIYDELHAEPIEHYFARKPDSFDLTVLGNVLEHFPKEQGLDVLAEAMKRSQYVLVVLPLGDMPRQEHDYGNPYEQRVSTWQAEEILDREPLIARHYEDPWGRPYLVAVLSSEDPKGIGGALAETVRPDDSPETPDNETEALTQQLQQAQAEVERLRHSMDEAHDSEAAARKELFEAHAECDRLAEAVQELRSRDEAAPEELEAVRNQLQSVQAELEAARAEIQAGRGELGAVQHDLDEARVERDQLSAGNRQKQDEIDQQATRLAELTDQVARLQSERDTLVDRVEGLQRQRDESAERVDGLQRQLDEQTNRAERLQQERDALSGQLVQQGAGIGVRIGRLVSASLRRLGLRK